MECEPFSRPWRDLFLTNFHPALERQGARRTGLFSFAADAAWSVSVTGQRASSWAHSSPRGSNGRTPQRLKSRRRSNF
jgi:hypothetical protein